MPKDDPLMRKNMGVKPFDKEIVSMGEKLGSGIQNKICCMKIYFQLKERRCFIICEYVVCVCVCVLCILGILDADFKHLTKEHLKIIYLAPEKSILKT